MATKTKAWSSGTGGATIEYGGQGDGTITITSDANNLFEARSMQITVETTSGSPQKTKTITINQAARQRVDISSAVVTASNQTYNGSAKTPTPTVKLNGTTIPSSGYDVTYSNNTNAGTATITVTGKGEYTGTATGTFTIAKASRSLSFNSSYMVLNTSSNGTKTATPSAGSGDGAITYSIANTTYATINSSSGKVTSKTSDGSVTVTATIAEGSNYLGATATYTLYVFATTHNYSYTGSANNVTLPPGTYQFQCWGAQGAACNDGFDGGKGGYSVGQLTIAEALAIQVRVGGQGGWNGGGSSTGSSFYGNIYETYGKSTMGNGGGATDIRLSDGALLSRMIVAGGGSGGAYSYKSVYSVVASSADDASHAFSLHRTGEAMTDGFISGRNRIRVLFDVAVGQKFTASCKGKGVAISTYDTIEKANWSSSNYLETFAYSWSTSPVSGTIHYAGYLTICIGKTDDSNFTESEYYEYLDALNISITQLDTSVEYQYGYVGGGTNGGGYNSSYYGKQNGAGSGGSFGQGANQSATNYRYCSGAGGGGWYGGGGGQYSDSSMTYCKYSGGGSGWVNTAANASYRPSGYTGLELDSGETKAGNTSIPSTSGGTETGHSGNGYARITRLS